MQCFVLIRSFSRGRLTSLYTTGWFAGSIPAAAITRSTSGLHSDWSWRIPLIIQAFPALLVSVIAWLIPESPRWNYMRGNDEKAFDFLAKYHGHGDRHNPIVQLEIREFREKISFDGSDKRWWDFRRERFRSLYVFPY